MTDLMQIYHNDALTIIQDASENLFEEHKATLEKAMPLLRTAHESHKAIEFILNDGNSSIDYEARLILQAVLNKGKGE